MTTDQLTGRALDEAAARAMYGDDWYGEAPAIEEMLAHLCRTGTVKLRVVDGACDASYRDYSGRRHSIYACGVDITGALRRLVVAVAAREAKA